jgi:hypothetical protein
MLRILEKIHLGSETGSRSGTNRKVVSGTCRIHNNDPNYLLGSTDLQLIEKYRVAAIFPEHFQSLTVALKNHIFSLLFCTNRLSSVYCICGNKNKQTRPGKGKSIYSIGSYDSCDSLQASRRMDLKRDYEP